MSVEIPDEFLKVYGVRPVVDRDLIHKLGSIFRCLQHAFPGLNSGQILDLGCGHDRVWAGRDNVTGHMARDFEPWLSRLSVWRGHNTVGVDFHPEEPSVVIPEGGGRWAYRAMDIVADVEWAFPVQHFDVVAMNAVVHTTDLAQSSPFFSPMLPRPNWGESIARYERQRTTILERVLVVLKRGGKLILNHDVFALEYSREGHPTLAPTDDFSKKTLRDSPELAQFPYQSAAALWGLELARRHAVVFDAETEARRKLRSSTPQTS